MVESGGEKRVQFGPGNVTRACCSIISIELTVRIYISINVQYAPSEREKMGTKGIKWRRSTPVSSSSSSNHAIFPLPLRTHRALEMSFTVCT